MVKNFDDHQNHRGCTSLTLRQVAHQRLVQNKWYPGGQPVTAIEGEDEAQGRLAVAIYGYGDGSKPMKLQLLEESTSILQPSWPRVPGI